jgi:NADH dehydrogenase FAD-containing subunit
MNLKPSFVCFLRVSVASSFVLSTPFSRLRCSSPSSTSSVLYADLHASNPQAPARIVVVGGGLGGLSTAFDANHILGDKARVTVVSDRPDFTFVPSNPWVAVGMRKPSDIQIPLSPVLPRHNIEFVQAKATSLNPTKKLLSLSNGESIGYDYLVIATGPKLALDKIPGLKDHAVSICSAPHAEHAYDRLKELVKNPGPVVVGATQGASCFGPAYEYVMLLQRELKRRGGTDLLEKCPVAFVTSEPWIGHMGLRGAGTSGEVVSKLFGANKMQVYTNAKVDRVARDAVVITQVDNQGKSIGSVTLPAKLTMFIPPFEGLDIWKHVPGLADSKGMILTNEFMQSPKYPDIFAVGVCAHLDSFETTPVPIGVPKTGYMIESMGTAVVQNIQQLMNTPKSKTDSPEHVELHSMPLMNAVCIADFGDTGAVFVTLPQIPPRRHEFTFTGKLASVAKVGFEKYFMHKVETANTDPFYEKIMLKLMGVERTQQKERELV